MIFPLPYSWLKEYVKIGVDPKPVARDLTLYGATVERLHHAKHEWTDIVVAEIQKIEPHPNSDKLLLATVTTGQGSPRKIVCGAHNIAVGQKVPLALPSARLSEQFKIEKRIVRGVESDGMLCSARELGLHDDHLGILILHPDTPIGVQLKSLGAAEDYILDVEPTTNRPDLRSVLGVAREVSAIMNLDLRPPTPPALLWRGETPLKITVKNKTLCPRYAAIAMTGLKVGSSPWWMQERLARVGIRPINSIVDITNYVMLELGQPLHAFDRQKTGDNLVVRTAAAKESLKALDGKIYELTEPQLVIADDHHPVALAGIMGGEETGVTEKTTSIILECATFDPVNIRRTSRALNISSEAAQLFEKGLSSEAPTLALARAVELVIKICGGKIDGAAAETRANTYQSSQIKFALANITRLLGVDIPAPRVKKNLERLGFGVKGTGKIFTVTVPHWRDHDAAISEDLVEEVARLYGYHNFPSVLPPLNLDLAGAERELTKVHYLRDTLRHLGFTETMTYSFIRQSWLEALHVPADKALQLANPLNAELEYMRPSLLPSLLQVININLAERNNLRLFECARIYSPGDKAKSGIESYRQEELRLTLAASSAEKSIEEQYQQIKGEAEYLLRALAIDDIEWVSSQGEWPFADGAAAILKNQGSVIGRIGLIHPAFSEQFGVLRTVVAADFKVAELFKREGIKSFQPLPKFPAAKRDLALVVPLSLRYSNIVKAMQQASTLLTEISLFDIYRQESSADKEQGLAWHLVFRHSERTLRADEVEQELGLVIAAATKLGARLRA